MKNNAKGILGLAAIAAGALGFWKYKNMTPDQKANINDKARKFGDTLKESYIEVEDQVSEKLTGLRSALERETSKTANTINRKTAYAKDVVDAKVEEVTA